MRLMIQSNACHEQYVSNLYEQGGVRIECKMTSMTAWVKYVVPRCGNAWEIIEH